jgi:hypothetical protein
MEVVDTHRVAALSTRKVVLTLDGLVVFALRRQCLVGRSV